MMKTLADFELPKEFETTGGYKATICGINLAADRQACGFLEMFGEVEATDWDINGIFMRNGDLSNMDIIIPQGDEDE